MKKIFLLLFFVVTIVSTSKSQTGITTYPLPPGPMRYDLKIDALGNKWVAFRTTGLAKFNGIWTVYDTLTSNIPSNQVNGITIDALNNVWVATTKGLGKFDGSVWTTYDVVTSGLPDDSVSCVFAHNTDIWVGTRNGLAKFDGTTWTVYNTSTSGLLTNRIQCVAVETGGDVWVGTKAGLFQKSGSTWSNYNSTNPYLVNSYNVNSIYIDPSNEKWFAINGTMGLGPYKLVAGVLTPITTLFPNYSGIGATTIIPYSVSNGPMGGVMFAGYMGMVEIVGTQVYKYSGINGTFFALDASGLVWYITRSGTLVLSSFDHTLYTGSALVSPFSGTGYNVLDINMVKAGILDRGDLHWTLSNSSYEVPKGSGRNGIFASALWIGGLDASGTLHEGAMTYRQTGNDFWPGPLDTISGTTDSITSLNYDKIWKVDRSKIEEFRTMFAMGAVTSGAYTVEPDILSWPTSGIGNYSRKLAPFIDVNGDGLYNPSTDGDYPDIKGDQMCFWIFNDDLTHGETGGLPMKVEIHGSAYAYVCTGIADSLKALNYTTFYNYKIFNRGSDNFHNSYIGVWQDSDLGSASDDYVGCTPGLNYGSIFNGDDVDDNPPTGQVTYGLKPPMLSSVILNGPLAEPTDGLDNNNNGIVDEAGEKNLMTHFIYYTNDYSPTGNPQNTYDFYNYMSGLWTDSTHTTYGGTGHGGTTAYNFMFDAPPGDTLGWSESNEGNVPNDRRFILSCGPFNLDAGANTEFDYAVVYTRDTASAYTIENLYQKNKEDVMRIQNWFALDSFPSCALTSDIHQYSQNEMEFSLYPNPASGNITISIGSVSKNTSIKIYDAQGRVVKQLENVKPGETTLSVSELQNGIYLIQVFDGTSVSVKRFVKI